LAKILKIFEKSGSKIAKMRFFGLPCIQNLEPSPAMTDPLLSTYNSPGSFSYPPMSMPYQPPYAANMGYPGPRQAFDYGIFHLTTFLILPIF
jgi:hypothetical protein